MKHILKIIGISFVSTIGALALLLGGMYLFGGFNEKIVYAQTIEFNSSEVISANTFSLQVNTSTKDVTRKTLKLETSVGGERVVNYPKTITIGEPFFIVPVKDSTNTNVGGVVELYARYDDDKADQSIVASCKILIDVPINSCNVVLQERELKITDTIKLATKGQNLTEVINFSSNSAILPYINKNLLTTNEESSIFSAKNFVDKKLFLSLINVSSGRVDENFANFEYQVNNKLESSPLIEIPYYYDTTNNVFRFSSDIDIVPKSTLGEIALRLYACKTYDSQQEDIILSNIDSYDLVKVDTGLVITNYTIDGVTMDENDREIYYNELSTIYLNNPNCNSNDINLNLQLFNNAGRVIDDFYLKNNVYISIENDISDTLTKMDGSTGDDGALNVVYENIIQDKTTWGWKYFYNDFNTYFTYKNNQTQNNKIKVKIQYVDSKNTYTKYFYLIPKAKEVENVSTKYPASQDQFIFKSGEELRLTNANFVFDYQNGNTASFEDLAYYLPYNEENNIQTIPSSNGTYKVSFKTFVTSGGKISRFEKVVDWCNLNNTIVRFKQQDKIYEIIYDSLGNSSSTESGIEFLANSELEVEIESLVKKTSLTNLTIIFSFSCGGELIEIKAGKVKFYSITGGLTSSLPVLSINNVNFGVDYEFVTIDTVDNLFLIDSKDSSYVVSGIGSFVIVARLAFFGSEGISLLGKQTDVRVYVYEDISSIEIYSYNGDVKENFEKTLSYDEGQADKFYLFVTSTQLETLKRLKESGQLLISFNQQFGNLNVEDYMSAVSMGLDEINSNAITFGTWEEVYDGGENPNFIGYKIWYQINQVHSIQIDGDKLDSKFDIKVYVDNSSGDRVGGKFIYKDLSFSNALSIEIVDKLLIYSQIKYGDSSYGSSTNPLTLTAVAVGSEVGWQISGVASPNVVVELTSLKYGFKYKDTDDDTFVTDLLKFSMTEEDDDIIINRVSDFYNFTVARDGVGGLTFKNVPYKVDGIKFRLKIYSDQISDTNSYYDWNGTDFVQKICDQIKNGAEFYFVLRGFDIQITVQDNLLEGVQGNSYTAIGNNTDAIFRIDNYPETISFEKLFKCKISMSNSSKDNVELSYDFKSLNVVGDFLSDDKLIFTFYYGTDESNSFKVSNLSGERVSTISVPVTSAFNIETPSLQFEAPNSRVNFVNITYKKDDSNAIDSKVNISISIVEDSQNIISVDENNLLSFKSMKGIYQATIRLTVRHIETGNLKSFDHNISIVSKFSDDELQIGEYDSENNKYKIHANILQSLKNGKIILSEDLLANKSNINNIVVTFSNVDTTDTLSAQTHMAYKFVASIKDLEIISYDLNYDKEVIIDLTFYFNDGGTFATQKQVLIEKNMQLTLPTYTNLKTGNYIDLGDASIYNLTRDGVRVELDANDFSEENEDRKYDKSKGSFGYDEDIFDDVSSMFSSIMMLKVKYDIERGGQTVVTTITFNYVTEWNYILSFDVDINVKLTGSA